MGNVSGLDVGVDNSSHWSLVLVRDTVDVVSNDIGVGLDAVRLLVSCLGVISDLHGIVELG